ncbi:MAG: hypothetical protein IH597_15040 [Bacteroidales bacterium]|nr:hypothetical protein [Bacteroidales bacterium]
MNITKDEARILAAALDEAMYDFTERISDNKEEANKNITALISLKERLEVFSYDERRRGRRSMNSFTDTLNRFCNGKRHN